MILQRKKNDIKDIKQGLSLDCRDLVKKVCIKNKEQNNNGIYNLIKLKNKLELNKSAVFTSQKDKNKIFDKNIENIEIINNILSSKKEKKLNFYDTGIFDMPLATQLGKY